MKSKAPLKFNAPLFKGLLIVSGKKQWQIAREINCSESYLTKVIYGQIESTEQLVKKIACALKTPWQRLVCGSQLKKE